MKSSISMLSKLEWEFLCCLLEPVLPVPLFGHILLCSGTGLAAVVCFECRELWLRATPSHRCTPRMLRVSFFSSQDFVDLAAYPSKSISVPSLAFTCRLLTLHLYHMLACGNSWAVWKGACSNSQSHEILNKTPHPPLAASLLNRNGTFLLQKQFCILLLSSEGLSRRRLASACSKEQEMCMVLYQHPGGQNQPWPDRLHWVSQKDLFFQLVKLVLSREALSCHQKRSFHSCLLVLSTGWWNREEDLDRVLSSRMKLVRVCAYPVLHLTVLHSLAGKANSNQRWQQKWCSPPAWWSQTWLQS